MNIVVASDNNFVQHCAAMIVSLLENNKGVDINIYLLSEGITEESLGLLNGLVLERGARLNYILVDSLLLQNLPMPDLIDLSHISIATYYRLLIEFLLPEHVTKVIYLDCDIIVRKPLVELWNTDIEKYAIGAVYQMTESTKSDTERLGIPFSSGYFNAGVLLINVSYWRKHNISKQLIDFLKDKSNQIVYHDQDALNGVLYTRCLKISCKWNMLTIYFQKRILGYCDLEQGRIINSYEDYKEQIKISAFDPDIVHFVSKPKPWESKNSHPFRRDYYAYLQMTPWRSFKEPDLLLSRIYRFARKVYLMFTFNGNSYLSGNSVL